MPRRRRVPVVSLESLPPVLRPLIRAAEVECPSGHAEALAALTALALRKVPARGIFYPGTRDEPELYASIDAIANAHLNLSEARTVWRNALKAAELPVEHRDEIESAANQVQSASDTAYFIAGLSFGLAWHALHRDA